MSTRQAKALITRADQTFAIEEVNVPAPAPNQVLIRTCYSGVSVGTEFALIRNKLSWGPYPLCTGYQATGMIEQVGGEVAGFAPGDKVYVRGADTLTLRDGTAVSAVSGTHASYIVRATGHHHSFACLPPGVDMATASLFVMPAVGLYGADMATPRLGETVVIYGCGLIGLGALAACVQRGCVVIAVDVQDRSLEMARAFGADHLIRGDRQDAAAEVRKLAPQGADVVFECTGLPACVRPAMELCRTQGAFVWQGNYGDAPIPFHFMSAHGRRLRMFFPSDDGWEPCRRAVLRQMALGSLPWEKTITHRIAHTEAPDLYRAIDSGKSDAMGIVINWENA